MIPLGISAAALARFQAALLTHHQICVRVQSMTLSGTWESELTSFVIDGQVNVDANADVTRTLTLSLFDPKRSLPFDSDAPADTALFMDRMIRVTYEVLIKGDGWVVVPVFTGPVTKLDRTGDLINVEAQGKEVLAMGAAWAPLYIPKGSRKTDAIISILNYRSGETWFDIPTISTRLPKVVSLGRESVPWVVARNIAASFNRHLFYDGAGVCRLRSYPGTPVYTFDGRSMTSPLQVSYGAGTFNIVWVKGATPKGHKNPITYTAVAPASHPLSPQRLGRNGVPRFLLNVISEDSIRSVAEARAVGKRSLNAALLQAVTASFSALPIPHLEPHDVIRAVTDEGSVTFSLNAFSLPLTTGQPMTVGYLKNVAVRNRKKPNA